jgi:hypothetical protein
MFGRLTNLLFYSQSTALDSRGFCQLSSERALFSDCVEGSEKAEGKSKAVMSLTKRRLTYHERKSSLIYEEAGQDHK